jgi:FixJ family two-component response regulator
MSSARNTDSYPAKSRTGNSIRAKRLIAIIDDDASLRVAIDSLLRSRGYRCKLYESAEAFLTSREARQTNCLICDIRMEGMSGLELLDVLLARGTRIPTIFITAFLSEENEKKAAEVGALCILAKPFDAEALVQAIRRALSL